jgi:hypothetical protein
MTGKCTQSVVHSLAVLLCFEQPHCSADSLSVTYVNIDLNAHQHRTNATYIETASQHYSKAGKSSAAYQVCCCVSKHGSGPVWVAVVSWIIRFTANG